MSRRSFQRTSLQQQQRRLALLAALALAACGSTPRPPDPSAPISQPPTGAPVSRASEPAPAPAPAPPPPVAAEARNALAAALSVEHQWLNSFFAGTPVQIAQREDGSLVVDVPLAYCFEPGASTLKPPLAKVLDKVAESLRRRPAARLSYLAAPADGGGPAALALQRASRVQNHLRERGVARARLGVPTSTVVAAVQLRIGAQAPQP